MRTSSLKKAALIFIYILSFAFIAPAQDIYWNGITVTPTSVPAGANYSVGSITQNNNNGTTDFSTTASASSGYTFTLNSLSTPASGTNNLGLACRAGSLNTSSQGSAYIEVAVSPGAGYKLDISHINFGVRSTLTGPQAYSIRYSIAGGAFTDAMTGSLANNSNWVSKVNQVSISAGMGEAVTIRIYGYNGTGVPANNTANWRLDDIVIATSASLPVTFGAIHAVQNNNAVNIKWTTLKEANNDHFEVQASKDGKEFTTIKTVRSANGNSDIAQDYEVNFTALDIASLSGFPVFLVLLSLGLNRRKRLIAGIVVLVVLVVQFSSCSKQSGSIDISNIEKAFFRIKQVDVDGKYEYSKVVQLIRE